MIVATGLGAVSAVGRTVGAVWEALRDGRDGIRTIRRFSIPGLEAGLAGLVPGSDEPGFEHRGASVRFGIAAAREAWLHAGLDRTRPAAERIAIVVGTSIGDDLYDPTPLEQVTERIGKELGIAGPHITVSTACTSSTNAIGLALDLIASDCADVVIAGGTDVLTPEIYAGFHAIGVLSTQKCAPFSVPFGTTLGEGAGFLVLERAAHATARGAAPLVALCGYGLSGDGYHETSPDPNGGGVARAIASAIADAGLVPTDIGYVNAHGTGTEANDPAEWRALTRVLGPHAETIPVSSTKSVLGHAQGAAGVLEMIATIVALRAQVVPQTLQFTQPRARGPHDPVGRQTPRPTAYSYAVCTNSAFGGANAAVVVADVAAPIPVRADRRRDVFVRGIGCVGNHGTTLDALWSALARGQRCAANAAPIQLDQLVATASSRGVDPTARLLTAAAALALEDAGVRLRKADCERAGLIVGSTRVSPATAHEFRTSIAERGLDQLSAPAFARMVLNASGGACSKLLGLKGPNSTIDTGDGSGLVALVYAAQLLAARQGADVIVAGGVDEIDAEDPDRCDSDGATCAVLGTSGSIASPQPDLSIRIAGWGLTGPGRIAAAVERALATASIGERDIDATFGSRSMLDRPHLDPSAVFGRAPASSSAVAFAAAVLALRRGEGRTALVASAGGSSACALVLTTSEVRHGS